MSNLALVKSQQVSGTLTIQSMDDLARLSDMMVKSGFFEDCKTAAQAGAKIMAGLEIGVPAFAALSGIHIIKGKAAIGANLMAAKIKGSGKYDYRVTRHDDEACCITFYQGKDVIGTSEFTSEDARRMGTQNMQKMPKNMLFARAMSNGVKWYCPDVFLGAPVYTPDELGAQVDEDGEVINVSTQAAGAATPTSNYTAVRLQEISKRTGFDFSKLATIAKKQKPAVNIDAMNDAECNRLRDAVFAAWGSELDGAFAAPKHAWNAYQAYLKTVVDGAGDDEIWDGWEINVASRFAAAHPAAGAEVVEDEF